jgi:hypothetical protein
MHLRYGLNLGDQWRDLALGPARQELIARIRDASTALVRIFLGPGGEAPDNYWDECAALFEAIHQAGASPMIAFACPQSWKDPDAVRSFARECSELSERAVDRWGREAVAAWFWSIGDEPNSPWTNGGLTFEGYRDIYETAADAIRQRIGSAGPRPRIGGPCVDGFQPFWFDWIWRFVEEVDNSLIGFVAWNRYGDWREPGAWSAPADPGIFERVLLSRTSEYGSRAEAVGRLLEGRGILNICSELNAHSHTDPAIVARFNQGLFGAMYYGSALIDLLRGGADGELVWTGACDSGPYSLVDARGATTLAYEAKKLVACNIRFGDCISFPLDADPEPDLDAAAVAGETGSKAALLVHRRDCARELVLSRWPELSGFSRATLVCGPGAPVCRDIRQNVLSLPGYAVALLHQREES